MKHNIKRIRYIFLVSIIIIIITAIAVSFEFRLSETVIDIARQKVKSQAYIIISERIWEELDKSNISYDNLVNFEDAGTGLNVPPKGKHFFGAVTVGERGQIVIPKKARDVFHIKPGHTVVIVGDEERGLAIVPESYMNVFFNLPKNTAR